MKLNVLSISLAMGFLAACNALAAPSGVPGRIYSDKVQAESTKPETAWWYQGETVTFNVVSTCKLDPINLLASNVVIYLDICNATNAAEVYVSQEGTITASNA
ncbi:MAG: hypothetical protein PHP44_11050, partial [Kiritimatiellae bacterium]|nr:hypothetical protein [Kiritimatiellia bacterium]